MAADAGARAALLASCGARGDLTALDQWLEVVGAESTVVDGTGPAVPGGLAIKLFPCCCAMQRPIHAVRAALAGGDPSSVRGVRVRTPAGTVQPLIHDRPGTGLEGKFSLEYAVATALLDGFPTIASFTDEAVRRPAATAIIESVSVLLDPGGVGLLDGTCDVALQFVDGSTGQATLATPPGSPPCPPTREELDQKLYACSPQAADALSSLGWRDAASLLTATVGRPTGA
ncbi:MAG: hypothetical protein ABWZ76_00630 [Acidimicrobiales bacterium]